MKTTSLGKTLIAILVVFITIAVSPVSIAKATEQETEIKQFFKYNGKNYEFVCINKDADSGTQIRVSKYMSEVKDDCIRDIMQSQQMSTDTIKDIKGYLLNRSKNISVEQDLTEDGIINVNDLITALNMYISNPTNYLYKQNDHMELQNFIEILQYNEQSGIKEFIVKYGDVAPAKTVSTTSITTTPKATTTTPITTTLTQKTTALFTTTLSQTTSTTPKVTIASQITTTVPATTTTVPKVTIVSQTTTTPVVTADSQKSELAELNIKSILEKVTPKDTKIPLLKDKMVYEYTDFVYLFQYNGVKYAYSVLSQQKQPNNTSIILNPAQIKGIHIWKYEGKDNVVKLSEKVPDTTGKKFKFKNLEYIYELKNFEKINMTDMSAVSRILAGTKRNDYGYISKFDYNLNGDLDEEDLQRMTKYYVANLHNIQPAIIQNYLYTSIYDMEKYQQNNIVLKFSSDVVEYAFVTPCQAYANANPKLMVGVASVQILPDTMYKQLVEKYGLNGPEKYNFIIWVPNAYQSTSKWSTVSTLEGEWKFTGFYTQIVDSQGNYIQKWIE